MRLRDDTEVEDPRLDRLVSFDPRSRNYPVTAVLDRTQPRSYTWPCDTVLDQGREGACVGFAWAHELAAVPAAFTPTPELAQLIYREAQRIDPWPGENYEGTSVLAGIQIAQTLGFYSEYRWAFDLNDALTAISRIGPAILGVNWYEGMFEPDASGILHVTGNVAGGHAIMVRGVNITDRTVTLHNSWGPDWGEGGTARISWDDLERLLGEDGECCIPVHRATRS